MEHNMREISPKSRAVAAILAFLFGAAGIHRFYVGKIGTGIVMFLLLITVVFWWVSAIWALIDFVIILVGSFQDKEGRTVESWG